MKTKIKAALQQKYPQLGLADEVFEGVASAVETLIKDEADIPAFVEGAEGMLKRYQADADKMRGHKKLSDDLAASRKRTEELEAKIKELEGKGDGNGSGSGDGSGDGQGKTDDLLKLISEAVSAAVKPLQDELATFKGEQTQKIAIKTAKDKFFANDYAKKYETERDDAWERAMEKFEDTGSKMNADELHNTVMGYFNKYVSRKGVDLTQPFKPDDGGSGTENFDAFDRVIAKENEK